MPDEAAPELLAARALAFPLLDEAFETCAVELPGDEDGAPRGLAKAFERWARLREDGTSLEALRQAHRRWWAREPGAVGAHTLRAYLHRVAHHLLVCHGERVLLAAAGDGARARSEDGEQQLALQAVRWRWVTFYLPADLFVAALRADLDDPPPAECHVRLTTPHVQALLQGDVAQAHLHVGAGFGFGDLWAGLMGQLGNDPAGENPPPTPATLARSFDAGDEAAARLAERLVAAAVARLLLTRHLLAPHEDDLRACLEPTGASPPIGPTLDAFVSALPRLPDGAPARAVAQALLSVLAGARPRLADADPHCDYAQALRLYRQLTFRPEHGPRAKAHGDPLADVFASEHGTLPETLFVVEALRYLRAREAGARRDLAFERLFWQYQRVRDALYRYVVQEPGTAGLDWFTRYYDRIRNVNGGVKERRTWLAFALESRDLRLRSLELRTSPDPDWKDVRRQVMEVAEAARDHNRSLHDSERTEAGFVLHLIKEHRAAGGARRLHADPRAYSGGGRWGAWYADRRRQCRAIASALDRRPDLLLVLRGLDAANVELAVPLWVLAPLFRLTRRASERAAALLARTHPHWHVPPLRQTLHAGEDFRHLAEGLRRIHEPLEFGLLHVGDRLGHGFALGVDPADWADAHPSVHQPREERLDDLLWELERYGRGELPADASRLERVRREAAEHARVIYGQAELDELLAMRRCLFDEHALSALGYPDVDPRVAARGPLWLLQRALSDRGVYERGAAALDVRVDATDVAMLRAAQAFLRRQLGLHEITVEVNPSSNLLIGDLADLESHPLFRLQPLPGRPLPEGGAVLATINDDDPLTFATKLADEYAYLYFGLLRHGVCAQEALAYLERLRDNAWRARFTLPASRCPHNLAEVARSPFA